MENYLIARIGENKIAIDVKNIHFVIRNNGIVSAPDMPEGISGVISFRDRVIPVIDNKTILNLTNDSRPKKRIVLYEIKKKLLFGISIDQYLEIKKINKKDTKKLTLNLGNEIIPIIDLKKLLSEEEIEFAKKI